MAKKESTFINMTATLLTVTLLASSAVAFVYEKTKGPKAATMLQKKVKAVKLVVPEFNNNPIEEQYSVETKKGTFVLYPALLNGKKVGTAVETFSNKGFGGTIKLMVGFVPTGEIYDIAVLEQKETPGLGDKMDKSKSNFSQQFKGKAPKTFRLKVKKDGGDVDAITAATISSRAFCDAVGNAFNALQSEAQP